MSDFIEVGKQKGYIQILDGGTRIHYIVPDKKYKFSDPEEKVRAEYYVELIEWYQYPETRIDLEVEVPRRTPSDFADIVIFRDDAKMKPYIVVECKKPDIKQVEFKQAIEQVFGNCNPLRGNYAAVIVGNTRRFFDVKNFTPRERNKNIIADIPIGYGAVQEWRYKQGSANWDLQIADMRDLIRILEACHDTLWDGGNFPNQRLLMNSLSCFLSKSKTKGKHDWMENPMIFKLRHGNFPNQLQIGLTDYIRRQSSEPPKCSPKIYNWMIDGCSPLLITCKELTSTKLT